MKKRGQATIFVIVGLILLIIIGLAVYLSNQTSITDIPIEEKFQQDYDAKVLPMANDIKFCIETLGEEALVEIGVYGGYLKPRPEWQYKMQPEYMNDALEIFKDSNLIVPYWMYIEGGPRCTNCKLQFYPPSLNGNGPNSIEGQVKEYLEEKLPVCMKNFEGYQNNFEVEYGRPEATVVFRDEDTYIGLFWPVNATFNDGTKQSISKYNAQVDISMKRIYNVANSLLFQMEIMGPDRKFELFTKELLSYYGARGQDAIIPPMNGETDVSFGGVKYWTKGKTKEIINDALVENIQYMQLYGSKDSYYLFDDNNSVKETIYSNFQNIVYINEADLSRTRVRFNYFPDFPMYMDISPSMGEAVMPESVNMNLLLFQFGITRYRFFYDITYPVLVTLEDPYARDGKGYLFQYAFEVNMRNNRAYMNSTFPNVSWIEERENNRSDFGMPDQRTVPVKIRVFNGYDLMPMEGVKIGYTCIDKTLIVGASVLQDGQAIIDTKLPPCLNAEFKVLNYEITSNSLIKDIAYGKTYDFEFYAYEKKPFQVQLKRALFEPTKQVHGVICGEDVKLDEINDPEFAPEFMYNCLSSSNMDPSEEPHRAQREWKLSGGEGLVNPLADEEMFIIFQRITNNEESEDVSMAIFNKTNPNPKVELAPGKYKLILVSVLKLGEKYENKEFVIPRREFESPDDFWSSMGLADGQQVKIPGMVMNESMVMGYLMYDGTTADYLEFTRDNLLGMTKINIVYPSYDPEKLLFIEDLEVLEEIQKEETYQNVIFKPTFE